jgi:secreted trypsin-like serine protease
VIYYSVQYGVTRISSALNAPNVIEVSKITVHEGYVPGNGYLNDVAVVEVLRTK